MHVVGELVRSIVHMQVLKDANLVLGQPAELVVRVLEVQVRQLYLVDKFFAHLRADWDIDELGLVGNFGVVEVRSGEPNLIHVDHDKLAG